ncbi:unnamed protein product [Symbiodinium sp. CCMP2592]|nr:unnamed protein product [Symbiodinium sp. CCMP2592]
MAASDGPPTKICRKDWEDVILAKGSYENTLPDHAMPFVNRATELFAFIEENIKAIRQLSISTHVTDYRKMKVCFAAQMFGAGKTMLGCSLVSQLQLAESALQAHLKAFLDKEKAKGEDGRTFADFFIQEGISDVAVVLFIVARVANTDMPQQTDVAEGIADVLMKAAEITQKPLFVHLDEIGGFISADARKLRDGVVRTWTRMNQEAVRGQVMPRIYFYLSGKGVPLLDLGSPISPVGIRWIILDKLHEQHVGVIRKALLSEVDCCEEIDGLLCQWTGGAPRLLLYTLRYLFSWKPNLSTAHDVDVAMQDAYACFKNMDLVARDVFFPAGANPDATALRDAWLQLLVLAQLKVPIQMSTEIVARNKKYSVEKLLISGHRFFGDSAGAGLSADDVLERLVEHRIIVQACLADKMTWETLLSPLLFESKRAGKRVQLDKHAPIKWMPAATAASKTTVTNEDTEEQILQRPTIPSQSLTKVAKSIEDTEVSLLFIALALGGELSSCVGSGSLCLTAGTYCISTKGLLLFRPTKSKKWTHQCCHGIWNTFDGNSQTGDKRCLQVRPALEVIVASAQAVERFLGPDDFNTVTRLAASGKERSQKISSPFILRFFGFEVDIATEGPSAGPAGTRVARFETVAPGAKTSEPVVWARELARLGGGAGRGGGVGLRIAGVFLSVDRAEYAAEDGIVTAKLRPKEDSDCRSFWSSASAQIRSRQEGEDKLERAFQVSPKAIFAALCEVELSIACQQDHPDSRLNNVDDLATDPAIKQTNPVSLRDIDARHIDIYLYSQEAGEWQLVEDESEVLRRDTTRQDCYGFLPQRAT